MTKITRRVHQAWDERGHTWERQVYENEDGIRHAPPHWWRCESCGASGYGVTSAGGKIEPYGLVSITDRVMAQQGWRTCTRQGESA